MLLFQRGTQNGYVQGFKSEIFTQKSLWTAPSGTKQIYKVYQRNDIDWDQVRTAGDKRFIGKTNREAAQAGLPPQLFDGYFATLHHIGQNSKGALVEASTKYHSFKNQKAYSILHSQHGSKTKHPVNPVDHNLWKIEQPHYWRQRLNQ